MAEEETQEVKIPTLIERTTIGFPRKLSLDEAVFMLRFVKEHIPNLRVSNGGFNGFYNFETENGNPEVYANSMGGIFSRITGKSYAQCAYSIERDKVSEEKNDGRTLSLLRMCVAGYDSVDDVPKESLDILDDVASEINMWFGLRHASAELGP